METELYWQTDELGKEGALVRWFRGKTVLECEVGTGSSGRNDTEKKQNEREALKAEDRKLEKKREKL
jgi:hypothetical protein